MTGGRLHLERLLHPQLCEVNLGGKSAALFPVLYIIPRYMETESHNLPSFPFFPFPHTSRCFTLVMGVISDAASECVLNSTLPVESI